MSTLDGLSDWAPQVWPKLLVLVPTTGTVCTRTQNWLRLQERLDDRMRIQEMQRLHAAGEPIPERLKWPIIEYRTLEHELPGYVEDVRQAMTDGFLMTGCEWLMQLDQDTIPHLPASEILSGAIAAGVKLTVGPTPIIGRHKRGILANVFDLGPDGKWVSRRYHDLPWSQKQRFLPIPSAGIGCALIHRSVLEKLMEIGDATGDYPWRGVWERGRVKWSEDLTFWARCMNAGFPVFADLSNPCSHRKVTLLDPNAATDWLPFHEPTASPAPGAPYFKAAVDRILYSGGKKPPGPTFVPA